MHLEIVHDLQFIKTWELLRTFDADLQPYRAYNFPLPTVLVTWRCIAPSQVSLKHGTRSRAPCQDMSKKGF